MKPINLLFVRFLCFIVFGQVFIANPGSDRAEFYTLPPPPQKKMVNQNTFCVQTAKCCIVSNMVKPLWDFV
jgi:hypothetical protein